MLCLMGTLTATSNKCIDKMPIPGLLCLHCVQMGGRQKISPLLLSSYAPLLLLQLAKNGKWKRKNGWTHRNKKGSAQF